MLPGIPLAGSVAGEFRRAEPRDLCPTVASHLGDLFAVGRDNDSLYPGACLSLLYGVGHKRLARQLTEVLVGHTLGSSTGEHRSNDVHGNTDPVVVAYPCCSVTCDCCLHQVENGDAIESSAERLAATLGYFEEVVDQIASAKSRSPCSLRCITLLSVPADPGNCALK